MSQILGDTDTLATLGLAPHSGWAVLVALGGTADEPELLLRSRIELHDARDPESKQPYHTVESLGIDAAARRLAAYSAVAEAMAQQALTAVAQDLRLRGHHITTVGILEAAGKKGGSLAAILASHALIHSADGDHYRQALASATERCGHGLSRVRARDLAALAAARLRRPEVELERTIGVLGRQAGPPWGADQKAAALLAWMLLAPVFAGTVRAR